MNAEQYLYQRRKLEKQMDLNRNCLRKMKDSLYNLRSSFQVDSVRSAVKEDAVYVRRLEEVDRLERMLLWQKDLLGRLEKQMGEAFDRMYWMHEVNADHYAVFLKYRFLMNLPWEEAGVGFGISRATVYRWRKEALALFPMPEDPIDVEKELEFLKAA